jgi:hypothetical protein
MKDDGRKIEFTPAYGVPAKY